MRDTPLDRYHNDPAFHALVRALYHHVEQASFTPTEIREAAMVAQMLFEMYHPREVILPRSEGDK